MRPAQLSSHHSLGAEDRLTQGVVPASDPAELRVRQYTNAARRPGIAAPDARFRRGPEASQRLCSANIEFPPLLC
jgi:hypothetical protein